MEDKRIPLVNEEPKHKKKSTAKGQPRAKHKHIYEVVLLTTKYTYNSYPHETYSSYPTKVCTICGRIDDILWDDKYYENSRLVYPKELSELALSLPRYKRNSLDKVATPEEETND